jgi:alkylation response protein AidB-like acyl-CoA dehydrogenase
VAEVELLDTWHVRGMRGTGTHHFAVSDVFVPSERTVLQSDAPLLETGPLYQIPRTLLFASADAAIALGVARSCLTAFFELAGAKTPRSMQAALRDQPLVQAAVGHAEADLRSGLAFLTETVREIWSEITATGAITQERRAVLRLASTHGIRLAVRVVDTLYNAAGVTAIYEGNLMQRHFQDIHVISQHLQARLSHYEAVGQHWLGQEVDLTRP